MINRCLNRVEGDVSGLTSQQWDPTQYVDTSRPPVTTMLINSSELCVTGFKLKEVFPPTLEGSTRIGMCCVSIVLTD